VREIKRIIIHHSATKDSGTVSWPAIRAYHTGVRGWRDIGYHAGVELINDEYEVLMGRPAYMTGAHAGDQKANYDSLGFVFIGDFSKISPHRDQLAVAAERCLVPWLLAHGLTPADLYPHRALKDTECPGDEFDMSLLRNVCWAIYKDVKGLAL